MNIKKLLLVVSLAFISQHSYADRIKDLASIQGVRANQLYGYGLVVGLDGTGDQTTQTPFTIQSISSMLKQSGVVLPEGTNLQLKNVAAVMVTANLPAFSNTGQTLDVTVSSMGNAKSLRGGTLLLTPLKGVDGKVYAIAQGNLVVGGAGAAANGSQTSINHLNAGRISAGATVERPVNFDIPDNFTLELKDMDFSTASAISDAINTKFGPGTAEAVNARTVSVKSSASYSKVSFISELESIKVNPRSGAAKVTINARTGSVIISEDVTLANCAISHGNLTLVINTNNQVSQPNALAGGQTAGNANSAISIKKDDGKVLNLPKSTSLGDVVKSLNSIGVTPQDLVAILQALKSSGSLHADLEII